MLRIITSHRGQALSYDALGGVVIFVIAIGILFSYWASMGASFSDEDAMLVLEANTALDRILSTKSLMLENGYEINKTLLGDCEIDEDVVGLADGRSYYLQLFRVIDENGTLNEVGEVCSSKKNDDDAPYIPEETLKQVRSERIVYYDGEPVKAVLTLYVE